MIADESAGFPNVFNSLWFETHQGRQSGIGRNRII